MSDETENTIQELGLTAPRITPEDIVDTINSIVFSVLSDTLTVCVLTLKNGFTVTGESACASPENFNRELGERIACDNAKDKIWALEGYLLKQRLYEGAPIGGTLDVTERLSFGDALTAMECGQRAARAGWNGKDMWIAIQYPDTGSKMRSMYIFMSPVDGALVPWVASQTDILARDWFLVP